MNSGRVINDVGTFPCLSARHSSRRDLSPCACSGRRPRAALDAAVKENSNSLLILNNSYGQPWTEGGFRSSFFKWRDKLGLKGRTFHDLRGTAVTRLALAGSSVPEIAVFTGHSLADVRAILDKHYLSRDPAIAESAAAKLAKLAEKRTKVQTGLQTGPDVLGKRTGKAL